MKKVSLLIVGIIALIIVFVFTFFNSFSSLSRYILSKPGKVEYLDLIIEIVAVFIISFIILNAFLQHKCNDRIRKHEEEKQHRRSTLQIKAKKHLHVHQLYLSIVVVILTFVGMFYTVFSDVFYQHGDPVTPLLYGLVDNKTVLDLNEALPRPADTTRLIYIIDVSGSTKHTAGAVAREWTENAKHLIIKNFKKQTSITDKLEAFNKPYNGLQLFQLKACEALINSRKKILQSPDMHYKVCLVSFAKCSDIDTIDMNIEPQDNLEGAINKILSLEYKPAQSTSTNYEALLEQVKQFKLADGNDDKFKPQRNIITIFSDFKHEYEDNHDSDAVNMLISALASQSTFFNLISIHENVPFSEKYVNVMSYFNNCVYPKSLYIKDINDSFDLVRYSYESENSLTFIYDKPFHVIKSSAQIGSGRYIGPLNMSVTTDKPDNWQQFNLESHGDLSPVKFGKNYNIEDSPSITNLSFSGHVPNQFSNISADFYFTNYSERISYEVIFKKGLPVFIAKLIFALAVYLILFSFFYLIYLLTTWEPFSKNNSAPSPALSKPRGNTGNDIW